LKEQDFRGGCIVTSVAEAAKEDETVTAVLKHCATKIEVQQN
jgi:hypothetical protein